MNPTASEKGGFYIGRARMGRRFWNRRMRLIVLTFLMFAVIFGVYLAGAVLGEEAIAADFSRKGLAPSWEHPFGTDMLGRDMLARTVKGLSVSILVGTVASGVSAVIALIVGVVAAMGISWLDHLMNWLIDLVMGIPHMVLLILISFSCGKGLRGVLAGVAVTHWTGLARLIRSEVFKIRSEQYVEVSKKLGHSGRWITIHHILPPEQPAIGIILSESMKYIAAGNWWLAFFPGLMLVMTVFLFDRLGENLKKILDPYSVHE